jgi:hypothetical protein
MSDLDYHNELVGRITAFLVEKGLRRVDIEPGDAFSIMVETRGDEEDALGTFFDVLHWMKDEGFIRVGKIQAHSHGEIWNGVQLTRKALAAVQQPSEKLDGKSVATTIEEKKGSIDSDTFHKIADAVGGFVGGVVKSITSG